MKDKMILIAGRSGSGKDLYARELEKLGLKGVKSYTTRPKRYETEDTHIFIDEEQSSYVHDKVATTVINGYEYFATRRQVDESDYYIIDPHGITELTANCPDVEFFIVYIYAERGTRLERAVSRGNAEKETAVFKNRDKSEQLQFSLFESDIYKMDNVIIHDNNTDDRNKLKNAALRDYILFTSEPALADI